MLKSRLKRPNAVMSVDEEHVCNQQMACPLHNRHQLFHSICGARYALPSPQKHQAPILF